jgi:hypothetical protein
VLFMSASDTQREKAVENFQRKLREELGDANHPEHYRHALKARRLQVEETLQPARQEAPRSSGGEKELERHAILKELAGEYQKDLKKDLHAELGDQSSDEQYHKALLRRRLQVEEELYWARHERPDPSKRQPEERELELHWNAITREWHERGFPEPGERPKQERTKEKKPWDYREDRRDNVTLTRDPQGTRTEVTAEGWIDNPDWTINWRSETFYGHHRAKEIQSSISHGSGDDAGHLFASEWGADVEGVNAGGARRDENKKPVPIPPEDRLNYGLQNSVLNEHKSWRPVEAAVSAAARGDRLHYELTARTSTNQFGGHREYGRTMTVTKDGSPIRVEIKDDTPPYEEVEETDKVSRLDRHVERKGAIPLFTRFREADEERSDEKVSVELDHFDFGNWDSPRRERQYKKDVYVAGRLSMLTYRPFEDPDVNTRQRGQEQIRAGAKLYGFDRVEFVNDPDTHTQALIAFNSKRGEAVVAFRGSQLDNLLDAGTNLSAQPHGEELYGTAAVHTGYHNAVAGIHGQILEKLQALNQSDGPGKLRSVCVAGHSQGGAEAQLEALWLARDGAKLAEQDPAKGFHVRRVYSFGAPHVSDAPALAARYNEYGIDMARVERSGDLVCTLNTLTPRDSYSNALGGSPPDEHPGARARVGRLLYIQGDLEVRTNPPRKDLLQDADATLANNCPNVWGGMCQAHLDYDKALFRNMDREDQASMSKRFSAARKEAGEDLWDAPPGTPRHDRAEAAWNAACREQQAAVGGVWTEKLDRRHEFNCRLQGPGPLNRAGSASLQVTVSGRFHDPANTINWFVEEQYFAERPQGQKLLDHGSTQGEGCLIPPEFGIDPRERLNYDRRAAEPGYALQLHGTLAAALPRKKGTELPPVEVEITLRSVTNRENIRIDFPPQIWACQGGPPPVPAATREVGSDTGLVPLQAGPATPATEPAASKHASACRHAHQVPQPSGPGM